MNQPLSARLREFRFQSLIREAKMIRDEPPGPERSKEASSLIYSVMYKHALGRLSTAQREQILQTVDFAREHHAPEQQGPPPKINGLE